MLSNAFYKLISSSSFNKFSYLLPSFCNSQAVTMASENEPPAHVVIFPLPAQGHYNSMLNLAHLLCLSRLHVTFVVSDFYHRRLLRHAAVHSIFSAYSGFRFLPLPDGLSDDHPRVGGKALEIISAVAATMAPAFKNVMVNDGLLASASRRRATCIVADGILDFATDFAAETGIPLISFRTSGAAYFWTLFRLPEIIAAGETPKNENDAMDELIMSLPAMAGILRRRDLPRFYNPVYADDPSVKHVITVTRQSVRAQAAIMNTFDDLEGLIVSEIRKQIPRTFTLGPIHAHLKSRLVETNSGSSSSSGSFWAEDWSCIDWLDLQGKKSVIYVSFGSITIVTKEQLLELWQGLMNSKIRFLWVIRPDVIAGKGDEILKGLVEGTKELGRFVDWAPQEVVLNHQAVGGFFTHSGWNSTVESIVAGVPMICWPYFADQMVVSRFVGEVWKIGIDIKDTCDRHIVENVVTELMEVRKDEFQERAEHMAKLAKKAISGGGSSYSNLDDFIEYINSLIN
ncbi:7-deoxyloganetic acid glucosyl transferase-like [Andrographis paniculata]|uniref:7-deoxyloganetic acid glucosyl transferase-like n=1 Tax=Andrographis paniculata TaxID=175694 RepID=UPI001E77BF6E|nr:7-deoxyloganetic acid glucosyl transferase-like [Andrographis paniculata]QZJ84672.1 UDP-glycosyltransferase 1 [Andrographis paniculata]